MFCLILVGASKHLQYYYCTCIIFMLYFFVILFKKSDFGQSSIRFLCLILDGEISEKCAVRSGEKETKKTTKTKM